MCEVDIVPYFTLGFPDNRTLLDFLGRIPDKSVGRMEFGFQSPDPKYDGPQIKQTHRSLRSGSDIDNAEIFRTERNSGIKLYALVYYADHEEKFGSFLENLIDSGFSGIILPDILMDYFGNRFDIIRSVRESGLEFIPFFTPATPDGVIRDVSKSTESWIYYGLQPSTGITVPFDLDSVVSRIREILPEREIVFGFGIKDVSEVIRLKKLGASGAAIGSVFVNYLKNRDIEGFETLMKTLLEGSGA
ncbi:MAG: tryptophan synthase subunit alpha [Thermoplasmata archaeon]